MNDKIQTVTVRISGELTLDCESLLALLRPEKCDVSPAKGSEIGPKGPARLAYSINETADLLGISSGTVYRLLRRGLLRSSGALRTKLIAKTEIDRFLKETTLREY